MDYLHIDPSELTQRELHSYLLSAVAPRPIAFASTIDKKGRVNLSPFSYFNVFSSNPPILIFSPARSGRDLSTKHTYDNVLEVPEVTINMVNYDMVHQMSLSSAAYSKGTNEFIKAGFTQMPSMNIQPPWVKESPVAFECKVNKVVELGSGRGAGNLIISEIVFMHINSKYLNEEGKLDTTQLDLVGRMGGQWYTRASQDALFQIPKPLTSLGIGVDVLPKHVFNSPILTGNDLGQLGNLERFPTLQEIRDIHKDSEVKKWLDKSLSNDKSVITELHILAKKMLKAKKPMKALAILTLL